MKATMDSKRYSNFSMCEYYRRIESLRSDGYRLAFDSSSQGKLFSWVALLIHHNGNKVRLICRPVKDELIQTTNGIINYEYHPAQMC